MSILHIDASARVEESVSRKFSLSLAHDIAKKNKDKIIYQDLLGSVEFLNPVKVAGMFTPDESKTDEQKNLLKSSDEMIEQLQNSDTWVIGTPMYNFAMPASLKAWADMVARAGVTFNYTENGPVGLLRNKKVYLVIATGGVPLESPVDFLTPWFKQFLNFLGVNDIFVVKADQFNPQDDSKVHEQIEQILNH